MNEKTIMTIDYTSKEVIETLKKTVAIGATNEEFAMFTQFCKATGLNPFKKEIWFIKAGGRVQLMTGINGFHAIANGHEKYDGLEEGLITRDGQRVGLEYPKDDFIGAWCKVYRKDRRMPSDAVAMLSEYDKGQGTWQKMRRVMIVKCAESVALRKAFPQELNGLYTQEEMPAEFADNAARPVQAAVVPTADAAAQAEPEPCYYNITGELSTEQGRYLEKRSVEWSEEFGCYIAPKDLGPKFAKYRIGKPASRIDDDLPNSFDTPLGEQIDGGAEIEGEAA